MSRAILGAGIVVRVSNRADHPQFAARLVALTQLSPAFRRLTIEAEELRDVSLSGPDESIGLYFPPPQTPLTLPMPAPNPRPMLAAIPAHQRPDLRWYTIRRHLGARIEVDVVVTGHDGPGVRWVRQAKVGDEIGVRIQGAYYVNPPPGHHLLLADETALPALLAIVDSTTAAHTAIVEVPGGEYLHDETGPLRVVFRGEAAPGSALTVALEGLSLPDFAWICAEGGAVAAAKRNLTRLGLSRRRIVGCGFWSRGRPRL